MPNNDYEKLRLKRKVALGISCAVLLSLICYSVLTPDPEEKELERLKSLALPGDGQKMNSESRKAFRKAIKNLKPDTRRRLMREIMRERLGKAREETQNLSQEEKEARVRKMVLKVRERFAKLDDRKREEMKKNLNSDSGKQRIKDGFNFYYTEFSAEERQLMDPYVKEILIQLDSL